MKEEELHQVITDMFAVLRDIRARFILDTSKTNLLDSSIDKLEEHFKRIIEMTALMAQTKDILRDLARRSNDTNTNLNRLEDRITAVETTLKLISTQVMSFGDAIRLMNTTLKTFAPEMPKL